MESNYIVRLTLFSFIGLAGLLASQTPTEEPARAVYSEKYEALLP
jgi:hypothetical protein